MGITTEPCKACGKPVECDPEFASEADMLGYDGELRFGICDDCAGKHAAKCKTTAYWARAAMLAYPEAFLTGGR